MTVIVISGLTYLAIGFLIASLGFLRYLRDRRGVPQSAWDVRRAPGPKPWPIIGNLHLLQGYKVPYQAFVDLSKKFGDVYALQLGSVPALVVHGVENIREVLVHKSHQFDSRPNFNRYHQLFHGNKENSLAFCDWSNVQKKRRDLLKDHVFPKVYGNNFQHLNQLICEEVNKLIESVRDCADNNNGGSDKKKEENTENLMYKIRDGRTLINRTTTQFRHNFKNLMNLIESKHVESLVRFPRYLKTATSEPVNHLQNPVSIKDRILPTCANIFLRYFCSVNMELTEEFRQFVDNFDKIFFEVNQGYVYDFLPFLSVFYKKDIKRVQRHSRDIRDFVLKNLIKDRLEEIEEDSIERDYVDALLKDVKWGGGERLSMETALFSLEDIIGGHTAIGNFLVKLLTFLVDNKVVQRRIREEVERRGKDFISLEDRVHMPYTEAVVMEALRMLSSPIVPHVSNQDTVVSGFKVKNDTLVFLNNYELNMSESLWSNPRLFDPTRFISSSTGAKTKPAHFLPFGGGKRSCMGYKLVQFVSFVFLANLVNNFDICSVPGERYDEVNLGNLALPTQTYKFEFRRRDKWEEENKSKRRRSDMTERTNSVEICCNEGGLIDIESLVEKSVPSWTTDIWDEKEIKNSMQKNEERLSAAKSSNTSNSLEKKIKRKINELVSEEQALVDLYREAAEVARAKEEEYRDKSLTLLEQIEKDKNLLSRLKGLR
ncbi:hypothetical protein RUM44_000284 [Polyplax serrata]|uniref:Cytochrome P450 n=1 Tax=Polyplax serrata TaxID=468196 RepID=A0ABR1B501_POLSC